MANRHWSVYEDVIKSQDYQNKSKHFLAFTLTFDTLKCQQILEIFGTFQNCHTNLMTKL